MPFEPGGALAAGYHPGKFDQKSFKFLKKLYSVQLLKTDYASYYPKLTCCAI
jgi:hypothetical protein